MVVTEKSTKWVLRILGTAALVGGIALALSQKLARAATQTGGTIRIRLYDQNGDLVDGVVAANQLYMVDVTVTNTSTSQGQLVAATLGISLDAVIGSIIIPIANQVYSFSPSESYTPSFSIIIPSEAVNQTGIITAILTDIDGNTLTSTTLDIQVTSGELSIIEYGCIHEGGPGVIFPPTISVLTYGRVSLTHLGFTILNSGMANVSGLSVEMEVQWDEYNDGDFYYPTVQPRGSIKLTNPLDSYLSPMTQPFTMPVGQASVWFEFDPLQLSNTHPSLLVQIFASFDPEDLKWTGPPVYHVAVRIFKDGVVFVERLVDTNVSY